jgi:hypothetical protein
MYSKSKAKKGKISTVSSSSADSISNSNSSDIVQRIRKSSIIGNVPPLSASSTSDEPEPEIKHQLKV